MAPDSGDHSGTVPMVVHKMRACCGEGDFGRGRLFHAQLPQRLAYLKLQPTTDQALIVVA
jgi:hypothetical protein